LTRLLVLFLIDLSTRRIENAGVTRDANGFWMSQVARNLSDVAEGFPIGKRYLIHDRDPLSEHQAERLHPLDPIQTTSNSRTV
jgi:putative transposase